MKGTVNMGNRLAEDVEAGVLEQGGQEQVIGGRYDRRRVAPALDVKDVRGPRMQKTRNDSTKGWREGGRQGSKRRRTFRELEWQAQWFAGRYGSRFVSTQGETIEIVQYGVWNRSSGPDFTEAAIRVNGRVLRRGAIELDLDMRDWETHGHSVNPEFDEVVLHVCIGAGSSTAFFTRTSQHRNIPQIVLGSLESGANEYERSVCVKDVLASKGRCAHGLSKLTNQGVVDVIHLAAYKRFMRKSDAISRARDAHGRQEALYQAVATGLGYSGNELPFLLLSQRLPVSFLVRNRSLAESLLFGVAGFIPESLVGLSSMSRDRVRELWRGWWRYRTSVGRSSLDSGLWRMGRQRPNNHPERRIAALAGIIGTWSSIMEVCENRDWKRLERLLLAIEDPFWSHHFMFQSERFGSRIRLLGPDRVSELLINAFLPAVGDWSGALKLTTQSVNRRVRTAAARLLVEREDRLKLLRSVVVQQGLLELYEGFCRRDASDCVGCHFPEQFLAGVTAGNTAPYAQFGGKSGSVV
ncbi:MAG: DUF2851 family protein [Verrucomicrobiota bacterium]